MVMQTWVDVEADLSKIYLLQYAEDDHTQALPCAISLQSHNSTSSQKSPPLPSTFYFHEWDLAAVDPDLFQVPPHCHDAVSEDAVWSEEDLHLLDDFRSLSV